MAEITHVIRADINLSKQPVHELCDVIAHVLRAFPGREREILTMLRESIDSHWTSVNRLDTWNRENYAT